MENDRRYIEDEDNFPIVSDRCTTDTLYVLQKFSERFNDNFFLSHDGMDLNAHDLFSDVTDDNIATFSFFCLPGKGLLKIHERNNRISEDQNFVFIDCLDEPFLQFDQLRNYIQGNGEKFVFGLDY